MHERSLEILLDDRNFWQRITLKGVLLTAAFVATSAFLGLTAAPIVFGWPFIDLASLKALTLSWPADLVFVFGSAFAAVKAYSVAQEGRLVASMGTSLGINWLTYVVSAVIVVLPVAIRTSGAPSDPLDSSVTNSVFAQSMFAVFTATIYGSIGLLFATFAPLLAAVAPDWCRKNAQP